MGTFNLHGSTAKWIRIRGVVFIRWVCYQQGYPRQLWIYSWIPYNLFRLFKILRLIFVESYKYWKERTNEKNIIIFSRVVVIYVVESSEFISCSVYSSGPSLSNDVSLESFCITGSIFQLQLHMWAIYDECRDILYEFGFNYHIMNNHEAPGVKKYNVVDWIQEQEHLFKDLCGQCTRWLPQQEVGQFHGAVNHPIYSFISLGYISEFLNVTVSTLCDHAKFSWLYTKSWDLYVQTHFYFLFYLFYSFCFMIYTYYVIFVWFWHFFLHKVSKLKFRPRNKNLLFKFLIYIG